MSHDHSHDGSGNMLLFAVLLTLGYAAVEADVGLWAGSLALAVFVGAVNVKDFFQFEQGFTLSIPESKKPDLSIAGRYGYLAAYNLIYVLPLALIVLFFTRTLSAIKQTEREGRLLKLMSLVMMLELGVTWFAARLTRTKS